MRLESTAKESVKKVWLEPEEAEAMIRVAEEQSLKKKVVVSLGLRCGLRSFEIPQIKPNSIRETDNAYFLYIPRGKDTQYGDGKPRDVWLHENLERDLLELRFSEGLDDDEPFFQVTETRIQQIVREVANECADRADSGEVPGQAQKWRYVSSHDLRRYFAHDCLVRREMNPRIVMEVGGWSDFESLKPYLNRPTEEQIVQEFREKVVKS